MSTATPIPRPRPPRRRTGRAVGWPTTPPPPARHPGIRAEPVLSRDPAATNTPGPPPYPVNPRPPTHRLLASQPAHPTWSEPPPQPSRIGPIPPPRALKSFLEKTLTRAQAPRLGVARPATRQPPPIHHPASSAGTQRQPASQGLRATPSIPRPQPHRLVRPAQLTGPPSVPPDAEDSPIRRKKPPQAISGQPVPSGDRLARDSSPLLPQAAAGAHRRPTVTLTPRSPKAREGFAHGRRNHRSRG